MFVINPDQYSLPTFRIGPFTTKDLINNHFIHGNPTSDLLGLNTYVKKRFGENNLLTINGREAIHIALQSYNLKKSDCVTIITTSQNFYISSCVTKEIEKFCQWNREIIPETKLLFVNHEFGYIYPDMDYLVSLGLPIIEDCCTTFFSQNKERKVGKYGDFAVYSFSKIFPIQLGGLLVKNSDTAIKDKSAIDKETEQYIRKIISYYIGQQDKILKKRREIYRYAFERFKSLGFTERFIAENFTVSSVLMLNNNRIVKDLPLLKTHLWDHGIQTSIFYGEDAFFMPVHQNLEKTDVDYFIFVIHNFIQKQ